MRIYNWGMDTIKKQSEMTRDVDEHMQRLLKTLE